jgi:phosphoglycerate dehydrogenase-like enzyme
VTFAGADDPAALARQARDAEVFYGWRFPPELVATSPALRWVQSASAGAEDNLADEIVARGILVTNGAGIAAVAIAEHVLALMLAFCRNLPTALELQRERTWNRPAVMAARGTMLRELTGSRVLIVGLGPIGLALAERVTALGAVARGVRRHAGRPCPSGFEDVVGREGLADQLGWADFVVLAMPHTAETTNMIGAPELTRMRSDAYLINVARGAVVDHEALVDALRRGSIAGAGLDVFPVEPLPPDDPLWGFPNAILTPHVAGATLHYLDRALTLFVDNLERYLAGRPLRNLVDPRLGYPGRTD